MSALNAYLRFLCHVHQNSKFQKDYDYLFTENFQERALDFNIILDDVAITELAFSPQYSAAVEAKQVAAQEAQRASFLVERAKQQRQEKIVQAEGEAQSAKLVR